MWCIALNQQHEHVQVIVPYYGKLIISELTWDGYVFAEASYDEYTEFGESDDITDAVWIPIDYETFFRNCTNLDNLHVKWSTLYALIALISGDFPGFTCVSATQLVIHGCIAHHDTLPDQLLQELLNDEQV